MDSLQLFTGLLLAVCTMHLIFSATAAIAEWLEKNQDHYPMLTRGKTTPVYFDWYVFFDPADLLGKYPQTRSRKPRQDRNTTIVQQRSANPRPRTRA